MEDAVSQHVKRESAYAQATKSRPAGAQCIRKEHQQSWPWYPLQVPLACRWFRVIPLDTGTAKVMVLGPDDVKEGKRMSAESAQRTHVARIVRAAQVEPAKFRAGSHTIELRDVHGSRKWHPVIIDGRIVVLSAGQQYNLFELLLRAAVADPPVVVSLTAMLRAALLLGEQTALEDLDQRTQDGLRIALRRPVYRLRRKLEMANIEIGSVTTANGAAVGYMFLFYADPPDSAGPAGPSGTVNPSDSSAPSGISEGPSAPCDIAGLEVVHKAMPDIVPPQAAGF